MTYEESFEEFKKANRELSKAWGSFADSFSKMMKSVNAAKTSHEEFITKIDNFAPGVYAEYIKCRSCGCKLKYFDQDHDCQHNSKEGE